MCSPEMMWYTPMKDQNDPSWEVWQRMRRRMLVTAEGPACALGFGSGSALLWC